MLEYTVEEFIVVGEDMIRIGVICPSEIAYRRFMPALEKNKDFSFAGVAVANVDEFFINGDNDEQPVKSIIEQEKEKAASFTDNYGGFLFPSYEAMIASPNVDAVYIPLPPALHFKWAKTTLENGKHVLLEKPATLELAQTQELVGIASGSSLALHENYMFVFHNQIEQINTIINNGKIGDVRLYRITFGFPRRSATDFRYDKELGGGALYDAGGYTLKLASMLLGESAKIVCSSLNYIDDFAVDIYGSATLCNESGVTAQVAFGMDNGYRCDLEVWGSTGTLTTGRILTAPDNYIPEVVIKSNNGEEKIVLSADDTFAKSIKWFKKCIDDAAVRAENYKDIARQASLVEGFIG